VSLEIAGPTNQPGEQSSERGGGFDMIDRYPLHGIGRHVSEERVLRPLDYCQPSALLDDPQAVGAVIKRARQEDPDHSRTIAASRGPEERINGGAMSVLHGTARKLNPVASDQEMSLRAGDVGVPRTDPLTVDGVSGWEAAERAQDPGKHAETVGRKVMDNEDGGREVRWQVRNHPRQGLEPTRGESDDDDVMSGHGPAFPALPCRLLVAGWTLRPQERSCRSYIQNPSGAKRCIFLLDR
jgi:hypothetical protein